MSNLPQETYIEKSSGNHLVSKSPSLAICACLAVPNFSMFGTIWSAAYFASSRFCFVSGFSPSLQNGRGRMFWKGAACKRSQTSSWLRAWKTEWLGAKRTVFFGNLSQMSDPPFWEPVSKQTKKYRLFLNLCPMEHFWYLPARSEGRRGQHCQTPWSCGSWRRWRRWRILRRWGRWPEVVEQLCPGVRVLHDVQQLVLVVLQDSGWPVVISGMRIHRSNAWGK